MRLLRQLSLPSPRLAALPVLLTALLAAAGAHAAGPHWGYDKHHGGPAHWSELDAQYESCGLGRQQSPVDIRHAVPADLPALDFNYPALAPTLVNNGHTVQINLPAGASLQVGERSLQLLQFHFHTPSEEAIDGRRLDMVAHFVHRDADGKLGVVAVLMKRGPRDNPALAPLFEHLPRPQESVTVDGLALDLAALLPKDKGYYSLNGSLTTPPCSEGVSWMVLKTPIEVGPRQLGAFRKLFAANARPLQPLNGRVVQVSR